MSTLDRQDHSAQLSPVLIRLFDLSKRLDYVFAFIIGVIPLGISFLVGAAHSADASPDVTYDGFLAQPNWWSLAFLIPAVLFAFRWMMYKIAPVHTQWPPSREPPIIRLINDEQSKPLVYDSLRNSVLANHNVLAALVIVTIVTALDMWPVVSPYINSSDTVQTQSESQNIQRFQYDWRSMFMIKADSTCAPECLVRKSSNAILIATAYFAQYAITLLGILTIIVVLRHNLFFLGAVYQRRRTSQTPANQLFQIDVTDINRCFGFRRANGAFNTQVIALMLSGLAMLFSRYAHTISAEEAPGQGFSLGPLWMPDISFPVAGQWAMAVAWLCALFIVALPGFVKLLPRIPSRHTDNIQSSIAHYLREFFAEDQWPKDSNGHEESIKLVASRFANNSFWPVGDNRARSLFFFSYWIFFVILQPPPLGNTGTLLVSLAIFAFAAYIATFATFKVLHLMLGYVDQMLITPVKIDSPPAAATNSTNRQGKLDIGVFISYRRKDTIEYARSIHAELEEHFLGERLFRDLSAIEPGENFVSAINKALSDVENIVVLIGADWVSTTDSKGRRRLHENDDMVRLEVATALQSGKRVIPVLLEGAAMPSSSELPASLQSLCLLNALEITDSRWDYDVGRLVEALKKPFGRPEQTAD